MSSVLRVARGWISPGIAVSYLVFGTLPLWIEPVGLYPYLGLEVVIWIVFAMGFNLLLGYAGLPSFAHGAFLGIGAYAFGLAQFEVWANLWFCLLAAVVATALAGAVVGLFVSHRRGIYYALLTIAFGQVFFFVAGKWTTVTGGEDGLLDIRRLPVEFGVASVEIQTVSALYWLAFAAYAVLTPCLWRLVNSPYGKVLKAIKQNENRVGFLGYNVVLHKWLAFTLSCAVAGLAGGLFGHRSKCGDSSLHTRVGPVPRHAVLGVGGCPRNARARQRPWISAVSARADSRAA